MVSLEGMRAQGAQAEARAEAHEARAPPSCWGIGRSETLSPLLLTLLVTGTTVTRSGEPPILR